MNPKIKQIQETLTQTQNYWDKYTNTTNKLDTQIRQYIEIKKEEIDIYTKNNNIEIKFKIIPTQETITKLLYLSKTLNYKFKQKSLTSYTMISRK